MFWVFLVFPLLGELTLKRQGRAKSARESLFEFFFQFVFWATHGLYKEAPTSYKWSYNHYKWPKINRYLGVISPLQVKLFNPTYDWCFGAHLGPPRFS